MSLEKKKKIPYKPDNIFSCSLYSVGSEVLCNRSDRKRDLHLSRLVVVFRVQKKKNLIMYFVCLYTESVFADFAEIDAVHHAPTGVRGQRVLGGREETRLVVQLGRRVVRAPSHRGGAHHAVQPGTSV